MNQKIELRKMRDFNAKMNATFEFLRQNFVPLSKALLYIGGPFILLAGVFSGFYNRYTLTLQRQETVNPAFEFVGDLAVWLSLMFLFLMLSYIVVLIVIYEYFRLYEKQPATRSIEVSEIWPAVKTNFLPMVGASLLVAVVIFAGFLLLLGPGVYLSIVLSLIVPILIIEQKSIGESFTRCFKLITDKWWSTCGLIVVTGIIAVIMGQVFAIPQYIFTFLVAAHKASAETAVPPWQEAGLVISSTFSTFGSSMLQAIPLVAVGFQYYNLVERREAAGLMAKLDTFGQPTSPVAGQDAHDSY